MSAGEEKDAAGVILDVVSFFNENAIEINDRAKKLFDDSKPKEPNSADSLKSLLALACAYTSACENVEIDVKQAMFFVAMTFAGPGGGMHAVTEEELGARVREAKREKN